LGAPGGVIPVAPTAYKATESKLGRKLAAVRMYARWDTAFPDATSIWARDGGRQVLLSVKAATIRGKFLLYRDIAAAAPPSPVYNAIVHWASRVKAYGGPIYFTFNHEPEGVGSDRSGTATEYVAAWRRIVHVFRQQGVRNAHYLFIGTANGFRQTVARRVAPYYPGDDYVDGIGADAYNWSSCRPGINNEWRSLADIIEPLRKFGLQHPTKGLWIPEFASAEDPAVPDRKAEWVAAAQALFQQPAYRSFKGILTWYRARPGSCGFRVDSSPTALRAYRSLASAPYYGATGQTSVLPP
jgi:hypothetical protein